MLSFATKPWRPVPEGGRGNRTAWLSWRGVDEEEEDELGLYGAIGYMAILTILISILSEFLVDSIEVTSRDWGVPTLFIAVLPSASSSAFENTIGNPRRMHAPFMDD